MVKYKQTLVQCNKRTEDLPWRQIPILLSCTWWFVIAWIVCIRLNFQTRMHSSRVCTVCLWSLGWGGGVCLWSCGGVCLWSWGCTPPGRHPSGQTPPSQCMPRYTPPTQCTLGYAPSSCGQNDRRLWKHYLSATSVADGKNVRCASFLRRYAGKGRGGYRAIRKVLSSPIFSDSPSCLIGWIPGYVFIFIELFHKSPPPFTIGSGTFMYICSWAN